MKIKRSAFEVNFIDWLGIAFVSACVGLIAGIVAMNLPENSVLVKAFVTPVLTIVLFVIYFANARLVSRLEWGAGGFYNNIRFFVLALGLTLVQVSYIGSLKDVSTVHGFIVFGCNCILWATLFMVKRPLRGQQRAGAKNLFEDWLTVPFGSTCKAA